MTCEFPWWCGLRTAVFLLYCSNFTCSIWRQRCIVVLFSARTGTSACLATCASSGESTSCFARNCMCHFCVFGVHEYCKQTVKVKKVKVAHNTRLPSVGLRSWSRSSAVSLQVTWVINPTVGCHYFTPGLQLPPQPLRGLLPVLLLGKQRHSGCENSLPKTVTWLRRDCDLNPGPSAPESSTLITRLPSHPIV